MDTTTTATATALAPQQEQAHVGTPPRVQRRVRGALRRLGLRRAAVLVALGAGGFGLGYLGTWPPLATVMSASMAPAIDTGDVVVLKRLDRVPRRGDVIAVPVPDEARSRYGYPPTVVHRVVRVAPDGHITTKGDARAEKDPFTVPRSAVGARVVFTIPAAGRAFAFLSSPMGLLWLAGGAVLLLGMPLVERQRDAQRAEQETLAALHEELRRVHEEVALLRSATDAVPSAVETTEMPRVDWRVLEEGQPFSEPAAPPRRRRRGGLVDAVRRRLR